MSAAVEGIAVARLTTGVLCAYVGNRALAASELPGLVETVAGAFRHIADPAPMPKADESPMRPAVPVRSSITDGHLVSLIDGKPYRTLRRHLSRHGHTPESYRKAFGLPADYPMTAPAYARARSAIAKQVGLGVRPSPNVNTRVA